MLVSGVVGKATAQAAKRHRTIQAFAFFSHAYANEDLCRLKQQNLMHFLQASERPEAGQKKTKFLNP